MLFSSPLAQFHHIPEIGPLPRYGSLTVGEFLTLESLLNEEFLAELDNPLGAIVFQPHITAVLASVLLISRDRPTWTYDEIQLLQPETRQECADFLLGERRRWEDLKSPQGEVTAQDKGKGGGIDWDVVYVRLSTAMPNDPRWTPERFAGVPIVDIERAIAILNQQDLMRRYNDAVALSLNTCYLLMVNGNKNIKPDDCNPWSAEIKRQRAKEEIPQWGAREFVRLLKAEQVPPWVMAIAPVQDIRWAAEG